LRSFEASHCVLFREEVNERRMVRGSEVQFIDMACGARPEGR